MGRCRWASCELWQTTYRRRRSPSPTTTSLTRRFSATVLYRPGRRKTSLVTSAPRRIGIQRIYVPPAWLRLRRFSSETIPTASPTNTQRLSCQPRKVGFDLCHRGHIDRVAGNTQWRTGKPSRVTASPTTICGTSLRPFFDHPRLELGAHARWPPSQTARVPRRSPASGASHGARSRRQARADATASRGHRDRHTATSTRRQSGSCVTISSGGTPPQDTARQPPELCRHVGVLGASAIIDNTDFGALLLGFQTLSASCRWVRAMPSAAFDESHAGICTEGYIIYMIDQAYFCFLCRPTVSPLLTPITSRNVL